MPSLHNFIVDMICSCMLRCADDTHVAFQDFGTLSQVMHIIANKGHDTVLHGTVISSQMESKLLLCDL